MAQLVSKAYSEALFEVALELDSIKNILDEFKFIMESFTEYPEFYELFKTPRISAEEKKAIIDETFKDKISKEMLNFLKILLDKGRSIYIAKIFREFENLTNKHFKIDEAIVESVEPLSDMQMEDLQVKLVEITGKQISIKNVIKADILGGLFIKVGDKVIDGTVRNRLSAMKDSLTQIILE